MYILPCPECGRKPKIEEWARVKQYKRGARRRGCLCPNYCSVIPRQYTNWYHDWTFMFEFDGDGDDNEIYKQWNEHIEQYLKEKAENEHFT